MNRCIFLVDDDPITHTVVKGVLDPNILLKSCYTLKEGEMLMTSDEIPALAIIDRVLPDGDGITLCTLLRADERLQDVPIIFLSNKNSETDKVGGLFAGADDYISKPVSPLELKARIQARLRQMAKKMHIGNLVIDLASHRAFVEANDSSAQQEIELTRIEFKLLITLAQNPERVFSRESLQNQVWGLSSALSDRVVDAHISHLRKKLTGTGLKLEALRGEGYRLYLTKHRVQAS